MPMRRKRYRTESGWWNRQGDRRSLNDRRNHDKRRSIYSLAHDTDYVVHVESKLFRVQLKINLRRRRRIILLRIAIIIFIIAVATYHRDHLPHDLLLLHNPLFPLTLPPLAWLDLPPVFRLLLPVSVALGFGLPTSVAVRSLRVLYVRL